MIDLVINLVKRHENWGNSMSCNLAISLYESHPIPQKNIVQWDQIRSSVLADCVTSNSMEHCVHLGSCKSEKKKKEYTSHLKVIWKLRLVRHSRLRQTLSQGIKLLQRQ